MTQKDWGFPFPGWYTKLEQFDPYKSSETSIKHTLKALFILLNNNQFV